MNDLEKQIIDLYESGLGSTTIGRQLNITAGKVHYTLNKYGIKKITKKKNRKKMQGRVCTGWNF